MPHDPAFPSPTHHFQALSALAAQAAPELAGALESRLLQLRDQIARLSADLAEHRCPAAARALTGETWQLRHTRCCACLAPIESRLVRTDNPNAPLDFTSDGLCPEHADLDSDERVAMRQSVEPGWRPGIVRYDAPDAGDLAPFERAEAAEDAVDPLYREDSP